MWLTDLSSLTREWTPALGVKAPSPNHWTTQDFPVDTFQARGSDCSNGGVYKMMSRSKLHLNLWLKDRIFKLLYLSWRCLCVYFVWFLKGNALLFCKKSLYNLLQEALLILAHDCRNLWPLLWNYISNINLYDWYKPLQCNFETGVLILIFL